MSLDKQHNQNVDDRDQTAVKGKADLTAADGQSFGLSDPEKTGMSLADLLHARLDIPSPFMKDIFLLRQAIVGTRYQGGSDDLVEDLQPGSRVSFVAEPDNQYDPHAVMALDSRGRKLGYIPRHENAVIGALLKAGKSIYGIVPDDPSAQGNIVPGSEKTPYSLWVDLHMREFLLPDDISQIPRQGYQGSYAVADFTAGEDQTQQISSIFAIKVINGEERDSFRRKISGEDPESCREAIEAFHRFAGYLPIVSHDITEKILPQLEEAYGVQLGIPFSNQVIDTVQMAANHMPWVRDASLAHLAEELGIEAHCDTPEETRCRLIWKLYIRMERSELGKKETRPSAQPAQAQAADDAAERTGTGAGRLDESIEVYPLSSMARQVLRANKIATLRELCRYTEEEIEWMDYMGDEDFRELMAALEREGAHPRPEDQEDPLYGYPEKMQTIAREKGPFWEGQILFYGIMAWYRWLEPVRKLDLPVWCAGEMAKTLSEKIDVINWIGAQMERLKFFCEEINDTMNHDLKIAVSTFGEEEDAQPVMDAVERLMGIYKRALLWRQSFSLIDTKEEYHNPMEVFFSVITEPVFLIFDDLNRKSKRDLSSINDCMEGRISASEMGLDLNVEVEIDTESLSEVFHDLEEA